MWPERNDRVKAAVAEEKSEELEDMAEPEEDIK